MGFFSWMYADTNNSENLKIDGVAYLRTPEGEIIVETWYDGYGRFGGYDIYDLVVDWNKQHLSIDMLEKPERNSWADTPEGEKNYQYWGVQRYNNLCDSLTDFLAGKDNDYMEEKYGSSWKREIGIEIACYDKDNEKLPYPIKVFKTRKGAENYHCYPASKGDDKQGYWY